MNTIQDIFEAFDFSTGGNLRIEREYDLGTTVGERSLGGDSDFVFREARKKGLSYSIDTEHTSTVDEDGDRMEEIVTVSWTLCDENTNRGVNVVVQEHPLQFGAAQEMYDFLTDLQTYDDFTIYDVRKMLEETYGTVPNNML